MKKYFAFTSLASITLALVFSLPTFAQTVSKTLTLSREATLGGQVVPPGKYTITFDSEKDGELVISKGDREIVKVAYKLNQVDKEISESVVVFSSNGNGKLKVSRIELKGMKATLQIQ